MGLKPSEYYGYTAYEYSLAVEGYQLKNEIYLDSIRWHATIVAKMGGAKKVRRPRDLMKLPLIDGKDTAVTNTHMIEYLRSQKAGGKAAGL